MSANAARVQKALGYRFVIEQATFSAAVAVAGRMDVALTVANVGSAPFYYRWPVEASLLDATRTVVWRATFAADITQWLPGGAANDVTASFTPDVPAGTYTLAISVLDPASNMPSLRFANANSDTCEEQRPEALRDCAGAGEKAPDHHARRDQIATAAGVRQTAERQPHHGVKQRERQALQ